MTREEAEYQSTRLWTQLLLRVAVIAAAMITLSVTIRVLGRDSCTYYDCGEPVTPYCLGHKR